MTRALEHLRKMDLSRPKKKRGLLGQLKSVLGKGAIDADAQTLLEKLIRAGHLTVGEKDVVTYSVQGS